MTHQLKPMVQAFRLLRVLLLFLSMHNTALGRGAAMGVYTELTLREMQDFTRQFNFGELKSFTGADTGVENTTYFVSFNQTETVLQIFEEQGFDEIPFFIELNLRLSDDGIPVALPIANREGTRLFAIKNKPAALFSRVVGSTIAPITPDACHQIGEALGKMHSATQKYINLKRENHRWNKWWEGNVKRVIDIVPPKYRDMLSDQISRSHAFASDAARLPQGIIHGDLFCDNALFYNGSLAGIIDFYNACNGSLLFDLAIAINDWCSDQSSRLDPLKTEALMRGYNRNRPLTDQEIHHWPPAVETAALRFWMLRLVALARKREGGPQAPPHVKDPNDFLEILISRRRDPQCELISR
ncbi:MAG: homoserine kinase [Gammaproteobacteria bacterium]|nr:homoserine kinase [Gammaproteobacteria bacterium]